MMRSSMFPKLKTWVAGTWDATEIVLKTIEVIDKARQNNTDDELSNVCFPEILIILQNYEMMYEKDPWTN